MFHKSYWYSAAAGFAIAAVTASGTASAQQAGDEAASAGEIIVTAQKRAQKLNDVGITISAATNEQLQSAGVSEIADLAKITPGFSVGNTYGGYQVFSLRGVNFNSSQFSAPPAVSTYVDEAILPYSAMTGGMMLDVDHVEVLKGPQGTLFGQNATGGSINIVAAKPTATPKAGFDVEVNNFGQVMMGGFVSGPLSETLRARVAANTTQFGAWQKGYYLSDRKNGDQNKGAARLLLDWTPTDRLTVAINVNANYDRSEQQQSQFGNFAPQIPAGVIPGMSAYPRPTDNRDADITPGIDTRADNRLYQGVLRIDYEASDSITLTSMTNYLDYKGNAFRDGDGTVFDSLNYRTQSADKTFSQELRLTGKALDDRITYIVGGNYQRDKIFDRIEYSFPGYSAIPPGTVFDIPSDMRNRSVGVFGNVEFEIVPGLSVTGGARYTELKQELSGCYTANAIGIAVADSIANGTRAALGLPPTTAYQAGQCATINNNVPNVANPNGPGLIPDYLPYAPDLVQKEHNTSWRIGANYKPADGMLLYGLVSRGFKAGLFPVIISLVSSQRNSVRQEQVTSYEIGAKLDLFDRAVHLNLSAFYYDYIDKQFFTYEPVPPIGTGSLLINVPKSKVKGIDADVTINPVQGLTLRGAITYVDTKVGAFNTFDFLGGAVDATGTEFNFAPPLSGSFDAQYSFDVGGARSIYLGGGGTFASRTFSNLGETPESRIPGYLTFDARAGVESDAGWKIGLFVRNLANKYYYTAVFPSSDTNQRFAGQPRTFGAVGSFRF